MFPRAAGPDRLGQRPWDGEASRTGRGGQALNHLFPYCLRPQLCPVGVPICGSSQGKGVGAGFCTLGRVVPGKAPPLPKPPFPQWDLNTPHLSTWE